jgi:ribosomal protein L22
MNENQTEAKAFGRYIRMSPNKVRRVLNQIRGKKYKDALMLLEFMPYRACGPVWQVIYSAAANAQNNFKGLCYDVLDQEHKAKVTKSVNQLAISALQ